MGVRHEAAVEAVVTESMNLQFTAEAMIPAPCPWYRRFWLRLRRKPLPTIQPEGTRPILIDFVEDGIQKRLYFPAARPVEMPSTLFGYRVVVSDKVPDTYAAGPGPALLPDFFFDLDPEEEP
jgi:hypothetical protein